MKTRIARPLAVMSLVASMVAMLLVSAPPAGAVPPSIYSLRTDGQTLVWTYNYYSAKLIVRPVGSSTERQIADNVRSPDVSGNRVIWESGGPDGPKLAGMDLTDDSPLTLPNDTGQQISPSIDGSQVVWVNVVDNGSSKSWSIMTTDLSSDRTPQVVANLPSDVSEVGPPEISGTRIVWSLQYGGQGSPDAHWELWAATIDGGAHRVANGSGATDNLLGYDIGGMYVVYANPNGVHLINIGSPVVDRVLGQGLNPTTDGRYVFWQSPGAGYRGDIDGYDINTDSTFVAVGDGNSNYLPWASGGVVAWVMAAPYQSSPVVNSSAVEGLLPSAPQPNPNATNQNWFYFPETSHYVSYGFKNFWVQSGGLPVFGYPLTEEFSQHGHTVQYFERQRFEYHPEFAGTPYEVELGRLGAEDASQHNLTGTQPFQPAVIPSTAVGESCRSVEETHHNLCGDFLAYWTSHGLEFGDSDVSYRESLALFGYPISERFTDPETGLSVQYFERAVFEYHPENAGTPYAVLLRRLGAERLAAADW